ncbi:MBL fold metallo-hydrolase [Rhodococcus sp. G-MC3]|uniref:MBL fold metallo-hydrolase n=1 Tax=Rhodococcus sp. G-MC3 TaxID=3046209 RepID=UPI0024B9BA58|nr:MBL fold metallo-hydrolase [Rhodococcus sp. G-MC3]MDJ0396217.1 MBL fold metallo-hydrolase [Rhodococcus sp. G-MC3]
MNAPLPSSLPPVVDTAVTRLLTATELVVDGFTAGEHFQTWCYIVTDPGTSQSVVIDPGQGAARVVSEHLRLHGLDAVAVVLTHGHMDHSWDAVPLASELDVPLGIHPADEQSLVNPEVLLPEDFPNSALADYPRVPARRRLELLDGTIVAVGALQARVISIPGHTPGSVMFSIDAGHAALFAGDSLHHFGPGLAAPPAGDRSTLRKSLGRVLPQLPDTTVIFNGHGPQTSAAECRRPAHSKAHQVWSI